MKLTTGTFEPLRVDAYFDSPVFSGVVNAVVDDIQKTAGAGIGSATIRFPTQYAMNRNSVMGTSVRLQIGSTVIFRGLVGQAPYEISTDRDEVTLLLLEDKWWMQRRIVGQPDLGTLNGGADGFTDVGFEIIFNREGRPNKKSGDTDADLDFLTGTGAVYWRLKDILRFLFKFYGDTTVCRLDVTLLSANYDAVPGHVELTGMTLLQAVDHVAQLAGESWGLAHDRVVQLPGETLADAMKASYSTFLPVLAGAGTVRRCVLFRPRGLSPVTAADEWCPSSVSIGASIQEIKTHFFAVSHRIRKEATVFSGGTNSLLVAATPPNKKFNKRFTVDVTKYSENNLGNDLSAGSRPKPWLSHLLTRPTAAATGYYTAAQLAATPILIDADPLSKPIVWIANNGTEANAQLIKGGIEIDCEHCTIDFEPQLDLANDDGTTTTKLTPDWANARIWFTVAHELESVDSGEVFWAADLPRTVYQVIRKTDRRPERRESVKLPDLSSTNPNAVTTVASGAEEKYVDVDAVLLADATQAYNAMPAQECPIAMAFPFFPQFNLGDRIALVGREHSATGDEVVIEISYRVHDSYETTIRATNVIGEMDPKKFVKLV